MSNTDKILARDCTFDINTGTVGTPVWVAINGVNQFGPQWSGNQADTTTFSDGGWLTHLMASRGATFGIGGLVIESEADGSRDPGQEACEALALEIGQSSLKQFRITTPGGNTVKFLASATAPITTGTGGGNDDPNGWQLDLTMSGAPEADGVDAAPSTPGTPSVAAGDDLVTVTWTGSAGTGGHFEVVSIKTSDSTEISRLTSTSPYTFNGLASGAAYTFKVRAIDVHGTASAWSTVSASATTT